MTVSYSASFIPPFSLSSQFRPVFIPKPKQLFDSERIIPFTDQQLFDRFMSLNLLARLKNSLHHECHIEKIELLCEKEVSCSNNNQVIQEAGKDKL